MKLTRRHICARLLSFFLCLCLLLSGCRSAKEPDWKEMYDLGIRYLNEGNYEEAILMFNAAIEINPRYSRAYLYRAEAYMGLAGTTDDPQKREEYLDQAQTDIGKAEEFSDAEDSSLQDAIEEKTEQLDQLRRDPESTLPPRETLPETTDSTEATNATEAAQSTETTRPTGSSSGSSAGNTSGDTSGDSGNGSEGSGDAPSDPSEPTFISCDHSKCNTTVVPPTCDTDGYTAYVCIGCGHTFDGDYVAAAGHNYQVVNVTNTSTCEQLVYSECSRCGQGNAEAFVSHSSTVETVVQPTCSQTGYRNVNCSNCGALLHGEILPTTGHSYSLINATESYEEFSCSSCGHTYQVFHGDTPETQPSVPDDAGGTGLTDPTDPPLDIPATDSDIP